MNESHHVATTRRGLFAGGVVGLGGLALSGCESGSRSKPSKPSMTSGSTAHAGRKASWTVSHGPARQSGVDTPPAAHGHWLGINLPAKATRETLRRALVVLDDASRRFVGGSVPVVDVAVELAENPGEVAIALGLGQRMFQLPGLRAEAPEWLRPIPDLPIDKFEEPWKQTDLVVQIDSPNPVVVSHVAAQLAASIKGIATLGWQQRGFRAAARPSDGGVTRNLFGQLDGQEQPDVGGREANTLWNRSSVDRPWLESTTGMVLRRIRMDVDVWESLDRDSQENAVGRRLSNGAPLTGTRREDPMDLKKTDPLGLPVINPVAHVPRSMPTRPGERILRRPFNYEDLRLDGTSDRGLIFVAFCTDVAKQFVPIQQRLAQADLLNTWTTPVGSAVYLVPAAPRPGRYIGQDIVEA